MPKSPSFFLALAGIIMANHPGLYAQDVTQSYIIPLETYEYHTSAGTHYKYGIRIGIAGGSAQVFEFDTGGEGFYAAWQDGASWWGNDGVETGHSFDKNFGSGISYQGHVVSVGGFTFYNGSTPALTVSGSYDVGRAHYIDQTIQSETYQLWPGDGAPVESHFYGDFGLSLKKGAHGVENIFAQMTYGGTVTGGYIVTTGTYGSPNGSAQIQVGLTAGDLSNPNTIWFAMTATTPNFPGSGYPSYGADVITGTVTLSNGQITESFTLGLNLDTGNPTPGIMIQPGSTEEAGLMLFTSTATNGDLYLSEGVTINISADPGTGPVTLLNFTSSSNYGYDYVYELVRSDGGVTYMNIGAKLFQNYIVTYDLEGGKVGLTPYAVPEPTAAGLSTLTALVLMGRGRKGRRAGA